MAFTESEIAEHLQVLEDVFWSLHRPPLEVRAQIREGQRFTDRAIELFYTRPRYNRPGEFIESDIAKIRYVASKGVWKLYWKRADGKWHAYPPCPQTDSLAAALQVISEDANGCFLG